MPDLSSTRRGRVVDDFRRVNGSYFVLLFLVVFLVLGMNALFVVCMYVCVTQYFVSIIQFSCVSEQKFCWY